MAKKRGQNEGSIRKRPDGTWEARVTVGMLPNGTQNRKSIYGKTRQEVSAKMTDLLNNLQKGTLTNPTEMTVSEWMEYYLTVYKKVHVKPTTYIGYAGIVKNHINPVLGACKLKALRNDMVQRFVDGLSNKGLAPATVTSIHKVLHDALEKAQNDGLIVRNVANKVGLPKIPKPSIQVLTPEQQKVFIEKAKETYMGIVFIFDLCTGMRLGELLGLKWEDIDFEECQLQVKRTINVIKDLGDPEASWRLDFGTPKTTTSARSIPLHKTAIRLLNDVKAQQDELKAKLGTAYIDHDLVFCTQLGKPLDPRNMQRTFYSICKKAGITGLHIHCLRHTFATRGLEQKIDLCVMQKYLGHASIKETADTYTHVLNDLKISEIQKLESVVNY